MKFPEINTPEGLPALLRKHERVTRPEGAISLGDPAIDDVLPAKGFLHSTITRANGIRGYIPQYPRTSGNGCQFENIVKR